MVVVELELDSLHSWTLWLPLAGQPVLWHSFSSTCKRVNARSGNHLRKLDTSETHTHATGCNALILNNFIASKPEKLLSRANSVKAYSSCIIVQCRGKHPDHHCHAAQFTYLLHPNSQASSNKNKCHYPNEQKRTNFSWIEGRVVSNSCYIPAHH
jgi:hypothetical protein